MNQWIKNEHVRFASLGQGSGSKTACVVDNHQYALLCWLKWFERTKTPAVLVSIDFHPDTDPAFWLYSYQKALAKVTDPLDEEAVMAEQQRVQTKLLAQMDACDFESVAAQMPKMNNDEQINTAMDLGILSDYHMITCMAAHHYASGTHYLVPEAHFGDLSDQMFQACGFDLSILKDAPIILDIDLDYFPKPSFDTAGGIFKQLVRRSEMVTMARSESYFHYLKNEQERTFTIDQCEHACLALLNRCLPMDEPG